jgi:anti-sigma B factor antagonist
VADIAVSSSRCPAYVVVALSGELDIADAARVARGLSAAAAGARIIVDLAGLTFIDCGGVQALVSAWEKARQAGGDLVLAAPQKRVARLLALTDLIELLPVFGSVKEAVNGARRLPSPGSPAPGHAGGESSPGNGEVSRARHDASPAGSRYLAAGEVHAKKGVAAITSSGGCEDPPGR